MGSPEVTLGTGIGAVVDEFATELVGLSFVDIRCFWRALVMDVDFLLLLEDP